MTPFLQKTATEILGNPLKPGVVGVEIELEGSHFPDNVPGWLMHNEGSLRGGVEYVTNGPVSLQNLQRRLDSLRNAFADIGTVIRNSPRTSTHIHVNMSRNTVYQCLGFWIVFTVLEPMLLVLCGEKRNGNLFCLPSYDCGDVHIRAKKLLTYLNDPMNELAPDPEREKYSSLNVVPLRYLGSMECRIFPSDHGERVLTWCKWLLEMQKIAMENEREDAYDAFINLSRTNPEPLIRKVFGDEDFAMKLYPQSPQRLVQFGCEQAHEISRALAGAM